MLHAFDKLVDLFELPRPMGIVEELPMIKAVVLRRVRLGMVGGRQHGSLVTIAGVAFKKPLHSLANLGCRVSAVISDPVRYMIVAVVP